MNDYDVVVRPLRFTDRIPEMRAFLETLGLGARVECEGGGWLDLVAGAGMVALHSARTSGTGGQPGDTRLSFESSDLDGLAERLRAAGFADATVWDETYGRVLSVTDPTGDRVWTDGYNDDDYGFRVHVPTRDERISVMPIRFAAAAPMGTFLTAVGLPAVTDGSGAAVLHGGHVGLVAVRSHDARPSTMSGRAVVQLGFATAEPLDVLAARLLAAGHENQTRENGLLGDTLTVVDPDDQPVAIIRRAGALS